MIINKENNRVTLELTRNDALDSSNLPVINDLVCTENVQDCPYTRQENEQSDARNQPISSSKAIA